MGGTTGKGKLEKPVFEGVGNFSYFDNSHFGALSLKLSILKILLN